MPHTVIALSVLAALCALLWWAFHTVPLRDLAAAPGRARRWRKEKRAWRKRTNLLPDPEPGSEAAEWLAYFRQIHRDTARSYRVAAMPRRRPA